MTRFCDRLSRFRTAYLCTLTTSLLIGLCITAVNGIQRACAADTRIAVPVPREAIAPGREIREEDLAERKIAPRIAGTGIHLNGSDVVGKVARRMLIPGQPIPLIAVKEKELVAAGQMVELVYSTGGLEIRARAIALQPGSSGVTISARNIDTGIVVKGSVEGIGLVSVGGPR